MDGGRVKLASDVAVPARTEKLVKVKWRKGSGLVVGDFLPERNNGCAGVYTMKSRVAPDAEGLFFVAIVNTTDDEIKLKKDYRIGKLTECAETVAEMDSKVFDENEIDWNNVTIGDIPN